MHGLYSHMQTALHIAALVNQLKHEIVGGRLIATQFYKKSRTALFIVQKGHERLALALIYHPAGSGCFCVPASKIRLDTTEKPWPIFNLEEADIEDVTQPELDRIFEVILTRDSEKMRLVFEVLGPNGNIWLIGEDGTRKGTLRNRKYDKGDKYNAPVTVDRIDPFAITSELLVARMSEQAGRSPLAALKAVLVGFNDTMTREVLTRADCAVVHPETLTAGQADALVRAVARLPNDSARLRPAICTNFAAQLKYIRFS